MRGRDAQMILMGKPEGRRSVGRCTHRWKDNIQIDLREVAWIGLLWLRMGTCRELL
jgi:hypothetical protein